MAMKKLKKAETNLEIPIVPLIDIVVELIIFFVITGAQQDALFDDTIKLAYAKHVTPEKAAEKKVVIININKKGLCNISNNPVDLPGLRSYLKDVRSDPALGVDTPIILRCDAETAYESVDAVMRVITAARLYKVRIAAVTGK